MRFADALDAIIKKEQEGMMRMKKIGRKADAIRYAGEEDASEIYRKTREDLKKETAAYTMQLKKRLVSLEKKLGTELKNEKAKMKASAGKRRNKAKEAAYSFLVGQL